MGDKRIYIIIMSIFVYVMYKYMNKNKKISYSLLNVNDNSQDHLENNNNIYHTQNIPREHVLMDDNNIYYQSHIIRKDTMDADPGNANLYFAGLDQNKPYRAWTTMDVSSQPSFYRSDFVSDTLGMKQFYDDANDFHLKPLTNDMKRNRILRLKENNRPSKYPNDKCYFTKDNVNQCDFHNTYRKVPYSLFNVNDNGDSVNQPIKNVSLNNVNGEDYYTNEYVSDKPMNGGGIFRNRKRNIVRGSSHINEVPGSVLTEQLI